MSTRVDRAQPELCAKAAPSSLDRRRLLRGAGYAAALGFGLGTGTPGRTQPSLTQPSTMMPPDALLDDLAQRTFRYFWDTANPANGLAPDCWPTKSACSIAALGFALTAYPIGVERGWITRAQASERVRTTLRFLRDASSASAHVEAHNVQVTASAFV